MKDRRDFAENALKRLNLQYSMMKMRAFSGAHPA
jgi:hypothetical protein